jgi:hypothetical protein
MADEPQKNPGNPISTEGFPIVYANLASLTANYNDLRIYFADAQPKTVVTLAGSVQPAVADANIAPRICMVMTPEFAKSLLDALAGTIAAYEKQFGPLRPAPLMPTVSIPKPAGKA